jgi:hypothetical protein
MYVDNAARSSEPAIPISSNETSEGFMLLRASMLKLLRLQLAIERHDRPVALASVDDLIALDRRLQVYLNRFPATAEQLMFRRELECEQASVSKEKLTLAAGILRKSSNSVEQPYLVEEAADSAQADNHWSGRRYAFDAQEARRGRRALAIVLILMALVAAAYLASTPDAAGLFAWAVTALR